MKKVKILYVEDEPFRGKIVKESLERRDYEVIMIADGASVINSFLLEKPDICVLDVMLPHQDGYALAKRIRKEDKGVPIIFVTAKTQTEAVLKGFESGGNDYLKKPFSMEELIVRVTNLLQLTRKTSAARKESISIGQFLFHPQRY